MIIERIESLILEQGMKDELNRVFAYVAEGIVIRCRKKDPAEIFEFFDNSVKKINVHHCGGAYLI